MNRPGNNTAIGLIVLAHLTAGILSGCGGGSTSSTPAISVSISGVPSLTIDQGQSISITAVVANDSAGMGVSWALAGPGVLTNQSATSVEYDAPTSVASAVTATVTATAVADSTKAASVAVTVTPIPVSIDISPKSAAVDVNGTRNFLATVENDGGNPAVGWILTQEGVSCSPGCGSVAPASTVSGAPATYISPAIVPANATVTLTAKSAADATKSASATITVTSPQVSIGVSPESANVVVNGTQDFVATVQNDGGNPAVEWILMQEGSACSPGCGSVAPASTVSGAPATYISPAIVPANATVVLTATSAADITKSASATISVTSTQVSIAVSPESANVGLNATQDFVATVQNDGSIPTVNWVLNQGGGSCSPGCGTVTPISTYSGALVRYTAPPTMPFKATFALTATATADATKSASATITVVNVALVPTRINFGILTIGYSKIATATLSNLGTATLSITGIAFTGKSGPFSQTNTCGTSVDAGQSCTFTVTFRPSAAGIYSASLVVSDNAAGSHWQVDLWGKGKVATAAALQSAPAMQLSAVVPSPSGPAVVGTRVMDLIEAGRDDPFLADGSKRELLVRFWYPAVLKGACRSAEYTSAKTWSYFSQLMNYHLPEVRTNSCQDARVAGGTHPIVVFTHGFTGTFTDYTYLFEDLASRGYVVASVDHTFEATAVEFPDGRFIESVFGSHLADIVRGDGPALALAVSVRLADLKFVVNELAQLNAESNSPFVGSLDTSRIALAGHSLGGLTTLLGVEQEPRFKAGIVLDGAVPDSPLRATETPVFLLSAGREQWSDAECRLWNDLQGPRLAMNIRGVEHLTPSDAVWLAPGAIKAGSMGPGKTIAALRTVVAAFLDAKLHGKSLDSPMPARSLVYPDAVVTTQDQALCGLQ